MGPSLHANCEQLTGVSAESMKWIFGSTFLEHIGEQNDFQLEDCQEPILGTFADGRFHSRCVDEMTQRSRAGTCVRRESSVATSSDRMHHLNDSNHMSS
jgi:hypothetical protein